MSTLINFLWEYIDFFLLAVLIVLMGFLLSLFFKKRRTLIVALIISVVIGFLIYEQLKYTTFEKLVSSQLHEETIIRDISITIYNLSSNNDFPERKATVTIDDKETIERLLEDFSGMKLKQDRNAKNLYRKEYQIKILTTNLTKDNYYLTRYLTLDVNHNYVNEYKIVSETNHLQTIIALVENEEVEWRYYNE